MYTYLVKALTVFRILWSYENLHVLLQNHFTVAGNKVITNTTLSPRS